MLLDYRTSRHKAKKKECRRVGRGKRQKDGGELNTRLWCRNSSSTLVIRDHGATQRVWRRLG